MSSGTLTRSESSLGLVLISAVIAGTFVLAFVVYQVLRALTGSSLRPDLGLPGAAAGLCLIAAGLSILGWTFEYRRPRDLFASTAIMANAFLKGEDAGDSKAKRTEPLIVQGPYNFVRNPMYLSVILTVFGVGLLRDAPLFLVWGAVITLWLWGVYIPREEKDLEMLFGEDWRHYRDKVPMLFPNGRKYKAKP